MPLSSAEHAACQMGGSAPGRGGSGYRLRRGRLRDGARDGRGSDLQLTRAGHRRRGERAQRMVQGSVLGQALSHRALAATETLLRVDPVTRQRIPSDAAWQVLGSDGCGWRAPRRWRVERPICYCVGAGEDISFDLALIDRFSARVFVFDPTPRAVQHVRSVAPDTPLFAFDPTAIWIESGDVQLFPPADEAHVSHSIVNLQRTTGSITLPARRLQDVMADNGHDHIDLLKLDIEGAEYAVIEDALDHRLDIGILNVEFDELSVPTRGSWGRIRACTAKLASAGYRLAGIDKVSNYTFVHVDYRSAILVEGSSVPDSKR